MIEFEKSSDFKSNFSCNKFQRPAETLDEALKRSRKELKEIRKKNLSINQRARIERKELKKNAKRAVDTNSSKIISLT
jgi:uncharacterized membrane protein